MIFDCKLCISVLVILQSGCATLPPINDGSKDPKKLLVPEVWRSGRWPNDLLATTQKEDDLIAPESITIHYWRDGTIEGISAKYRKDVNFKEAETTLSMSLKDLKKVPMSPSFIIWRALDGKMVWMLGLSSDDEQQVEIVNMKTLGADSDGRKSDVPK